MDITQISEKELGNLMVMLKEEMERRRESSKQRVIEELVALAKAHGYALDELMASFNKKITTHPNETERRRLPIKFRHPHQHDLTWTGRGIQPRWMTAWLAQGNTREECSVAQE